MNEDTYHTLREAGYPSQTTITELLDMLRGLQPHECTREKIDDLHAKACEVRNGIQGLTGAIFDKAQSTD